MGANARDSTGRRCHPGLSLKAYTAEPGSGAVEPLTLLATWASTVRGVGQPEILPGPTPTKLPPGQP